MLGAALLVVLAVACGDSGRRASSDPPPRPPTGPAEPERAATRLVTVEGLSDATRVSAGNSATCALRDDGTVWCWGLMPAVQRVEHRPEPTPRAVGGLAGVTFLEMGMTHGCAVVAGGRVRCWGDNHEGQLGDGTTSPHAEPVGVAGIEGAVDLALSSFATCVRMRDGTVRCFGGDQVGELGMGGAPGSEECESRIGVGPPSVPCRRRAAAVPGVSGVRQLTAGASHACALLEDGTARCWGHNEWGQLGDGRLGYENNRNAPVAVVGLRDVAGLAAGSYHTCAWLRDGTVRCWGEGRQGQHGPGANAAPSPRPVAVAGVSGVTALAAGDAFTCALLRDRSVRCWGDTSSLCPEGSPEILPCRPAPAPAPSIDDARQIDVGGRHACAVLGNETVVCWGNDYGGVLGVEPG